MGNQHFCNVHFFNVQFVALQISVFFLCACLLLSIGLFSDAPIGSSPSFQRSVILSKVFIRPALSISLLHCWFCCEIWRHTFKEHFFFISIQHDLCFVWNSRRYYTEWSHFSFPYTEGRKWPWGTKIQKGQTITLLLDDYNLVCYSIKAKT